MEKKMTYQEALNAFDAFANDLTLQKLGWKLSLYVSRNIDFLKAHVGHYNKANKEIIIEFSKIQKVKDSETDEETEQRIVLQDKILEFRKTQQELLDTEITVEYNELTFDTLSKREQEKLDSAITPKTMYGISYTIVQ